MPVLNIQHQRVVQPNTNDDKVTLTIVRVEKVEKLGEKQVEWIFNHLCSSHISNPWTLPPPMLPGEVIGNKCAQDFDLVQTQDFSGGFSGSRGGVLVLVVMKIPAFVLFWQGGGTE